MLIELSREQALYFESQLLPVDRGFETECLEWQGACNSWGYGHFKFEGKMLKAHRAAMMLSGIALPKGTLALHRCDNPPCCNIQHLFAGTHQDNSDDKWSKGRQGVFDQKGVQNGNAKLTFEEVRLIKALLPHYNNTEISILLSGKVKPTTISAIRRKKIWVI